MVMPRRADMEQRVRTLQNGLWRELAGRFDRARLRTDELARGLGRAVDNLITRRRERLQRLSSVLDAMSPMQVLGRGYSITIRQSTGHAVRDPADLREGEDLRTLLAKGDVLSMVKSTNSMKEGVLYPRKERRRGAPRGR
jgi:exodeoxyribonuclease VII large subunit